MSGNAPLRSFSVSEDALLCGRVRLLQPCEGYRAAIDPVFLAASVPAAAGERVLDLGSGVGAATFCLAARVPGLYVDGIEIQPDLVNLALENARLNAMDDRVAFHAGDILDDAAAPARQSYDHVMANPPHFDSDKATRSPNPGKALSNTESGARLSDWIAFALSRLKPGGDMTLVHRADRLGEILSLLEARAGSICIFPLWPRDGVPAKRVIVRAQKGSTRPARLLAGLALHRGDGSYTEEANAVLRDGGALEL